MKDRVFPTGSRRDNADGKPPLSKLPFTALAEVAFVHQYGDDHYGMGNWRKGQQTSTFMDCAERHMAAYMRGEDRDEKSGQLHLAHAAWNILVALHQQVHGDHYAEIDDRMDDFGNWINPRFAGTDLAKQLERGIAEGMAELVGALAGNGEATEDSPNGGQVDRPQNGEEKELKHVFDTWPDGSSRQEV